MISSRLRRLIEDPLRLSSVLFVVWVSEYLQSLDCLGCRCYPGCLRRHSDLRRRGSIP
jgi:hypothetical protein